MKRKMNVGIVGPGWASSKLYAPAILRRPELTLRSIFSRSLPRAETFAREYAVHGAIATYSDLDLMLADDELDIVVVVNPDGLHCQTVLSAAKAGKAILVEKPMALTSADCELMIKACDEAGVKLSVGYRCRFHGGHRPIIDNLHAGTFGRLRLARLHMPLIELGTGGWRNGNEALGKWWVLSKFGTHLIDLALWATQFPVSAIEGFHGVIGAENGTNDREASFTWSYKDGPTVQIYCSNTYDDGQSRIELHCDNSTIEMIDTVALHNGGAIFIDGEAFPYSVEKEFEEQLLDLADSIESNRSPLVTGEVGLENVRVLEMCDRQTQRVLLSSTK